MRRDIDDIGRYIADRNAGAARRFRERLDATIELLMRFPDAGTIVSTQNRRLKNLRRINVRRFDDYVVYYALQSRFEVVTIVHSAHDRDAILDNEI